MLQLLEDEGLVRSTERDGKRVFEVTDEGRAEAAARIEEAGGAPWDLARRGGKGHGELREAMMTLGLAVKQVAIAGQPAQVERAVEIVTNARKQLYALRRCLRRSELLLVALDGAGVADLRGLGVVAHLAGGKRRWRSRSQHWSRATSRSATRCCFVGSADAVPAISRSRLCSSSTSSPMRAMSWASSMSAP